MEFSAWNAEDKVFRWTYRFFILYLIMGGPGLTILFLYLLHHHLL
jgi:hypothetical protein